MIEKLKEAGYKKVILRPLMVVAGDHANNDASEMTTIPGRASMRHQEHLMLLQIAGLGEIQAIQQLYVAHTQAAIDGVICKKILRRSCLSEKRNC